MLLDLRCGARSDKVFGCDPSCAFFSVVCPFPSGSGPASQALRMLVSSFLSLAVRLSVRAFACCAVVCL